MALSRVLELPGLLEELHERRDHLLLRLQGDRENELGLPISAFMDRQKTSIAQCQMGFISVLVKPLYAEWRKLLGDDLQPAIDLLQLSLSGWETDGNKLCEGWDL